MPASCSAVSSILHLVGVQFLRPQVAIDCGLHQVWCQERQRYRHIDLTDGAVFSASDLFDMAVPAINSSSQRRPFAIAVTSRARVSARGPETRWYP
jgi:hypothetical protein